MSINGGTAQYTAVSAFSQLFLIVHFFMVDFNNN